MLLKRINRCKKLEFLLWIFSKRKTGSKWRRESISDTHLFFQSVPTLMFLLGISFAWREMSWKNMKINMEPSAPFRHWRGCSIQRLGVEGVRKVETLIYS